MKINGQVIKFESEPPQREGLFLFKGKLSKTLDLIRIIYIPAKNEYGIQWDARYAVANYRNRNVLQLQGEFCEIQE